MRYFCHADMQFVHTDFVSNLVHNIYPYKFRLRTAGSYRIRAHTQRVMQPVTL